MAHAVSSKSRVPLDTHPQNKAEDSPPRQSEADETGRILGLELIAWPGLDIGRFSSRSWLAVTVSMGPSALLHLSRTGPAWPAGEAPHDLPASRERKPQILSLGSMLVIDQQALRSSHLITEGNCSSLVPQSPAVIHSRNVCRHTSGRQDSEGTMGPFAA